MILIASDHAGFHLKKKIVDSLASRQTVVKDLGTDSDASCDYPLYAQKLCVDLLKERATNSDALGILICGSGIGMSIAANKVQGIRAAVVSDVVSARLAREHNDAQVLCLGARIVSEATALACVDAFLEGQFDTSNPRHQRRVNQLEMDNPNE